MAKTDNVTIILFILLFILVDRLLDKLIDRLIGGKNERIYDTRWI